MMMMMMMMKMMFTYQVCLGHFEPCFCFGFSVCLGSVVGHAETYHHDDDDDDDGGDDYDNDYDADDDDLVNGGILLVQTGWLYRLYRDLKDNI